MDEGWRYNMFRLQITLFAVLCLLNQNLGFVWSLNDEGLALLRFREGVISDPYGALMNWNSDEDEDPCSWFGVGCSNGKVVNLNLEDLCLGGTLASELGRLGHIKSIFLRNNSFTGLIPKEIEELMELQVLDLGYNNFNGPIPSKLGSDLSFVTLLLDNNDFLGYISPELHQISMLSELQIGKNQQFEAAQKASCNRRSIAWTLDQTGYIFPRRLLKDKKAQLAPGRPPRLTSNPPSQSPYPSPSPSPSPSPPPSPLSSVSRSPTPAPVPSPATTPSLNSPPVLTPTSSPSAPNPILSNNPSQLGPKSPQSNNQTRYIIAGGIGGFLSMLAFAVGIFICRSNKVVVVRPWATGLSGQLQKAFTTGVPKLNRSELVTACEDFSNVIESSADGNMYKGTLSSGIEIAVTSTTVTVVKDWSKHLEGQFRKKIDTLSKVNHKNFVNLLGFCEEEEPFTRMMVFEYAPNGTLFEHLHIKEAEHLEWGVRLRIATGIAYCLDYMHQQSPPVIHNNLNSTAIYLTEDYAGKISDFSFWNGAAMINMGLNGSECSDTHSSDLEGNVYSFGMILLEMITGRLPYSDEKEELIDWASDFLTRREPAKYMVDPIIEVFEEVELEQLCEVMRKCLYSDPKQRPTMREVAIQLREITGISPDGATPRLSPLWWAELEILSTAN